jgi:hypothetical protein
MEENSPLLGTYHGLPLGGAQEGSVVEVGAADRGLRRGTSEEAT